MKRVLGLVAAVGQMVVAEWGGALVAARVTAANTLDAAAREACALTLNPKPIATLPTSRRPTAADVQGQICRSTFQESGQPPSVAQLGAWYK